MANLKKIFEVALVLSAQDKASRTIADLTTRARTRIEGMSKMGDKAFAFGRNAGAAGLAGAAILAGPLKAAADMERLNVSLRTSFQGNEKAAAKAFKEIQTFAAKTPYEMEEVLTGFVKLKNMGLDPGRDALTAYGNTASAMGKSLNDMVEAVADAATGEFERLKEFGIKAKSEGDNVTFTFQGVKTTVGKNSKEIEQYLKYIGNVKFKGGIEAQSKTLYGQLSTLKDNAVQAAAKIGGTLVPQIKELFAKINPVLDRVTKWVQKNPELTGTILKIVAAATALSFAVAALSFIFGGVFKAIAAVMWITNAYRQLMVVMKAAQTAYTFTLLATGSGFQAVSAGLKAMNLGFLTSPIFWIGALLVGAVVLIWKYWGPIKNFFGNLWEGTKAIFLKFWNWLKEWGILLLGPIGFVIKFWTPIKNFFGKLWDGVKQVFSKFWAFVKEWGLLLLGPVGFIIKYWDKLPGWFSSLWEKVKGIFSTFWNWIKGLPARFFQLGTDIIVGVWNGIKAKVTAVFDFVKDVGKKIANAFKSVLGIASPSKVFMDFGVNIAQGAQKGIERGTPSATGAAQKMAKGSLPKPVSTGGRSTGGGAQVNVTFAPVISGGGDPAQLRSMLKGMIPELVREIQSAMDRKQRLSFG